MLFLSRELLIFLPDAYRILFCFCFLIFCLFLFGCAGSCCCVGFSLVVVHRLLIVVAPVAEQGPWSTGLQYLHLSGSRAQAQ